MKALHIVELSGIGGVEQKVRFYLRGSAERGHIEHRVLLPGSRPHTGLRNDIATAAKSVSAGKYRWGLKLPPWPEFLRRTNFLHYLRGIPHDVIMVWNRFGDAALMDAIRTESSAPVMHCECGSAWYEPTAPNARRYVENISAVVCASNACRRVLELRWGWKGRVAAVVNGLRPDCRCESTRPKRLSSGVIRLGAAARMLPIKGLCLAVHALKHLRAAGINAELHFAGGGSARGRKALEQLVESLDLSQHVKFHGIVHDMPVFYGGIDYFLCPSLREPFGSVCVEAAAMGCVVVATRVDGLVEAVKDGVTGRCVPAELELEQYPALGGGLSGVPSIVYDPAADAIVRPRVVSPQALAGAVASLAEKPAAFEAMSEAAIRRVREKLPFGAYVEALDNALLETCNKF